MGTLKRLHIAHFLLYSVVKPVSVMHTICGLDNTFTFSFDYENLAHQHIYMYVCIYTIKNLIHNDNYVATMRFGTFHCKIKIRS